MGEGAGTGVVHLVRKQNGIASLAQFLKSYWQHDAGLAHDLVILFKGFKDENDSSPHRALLANLSYQPLFVDDSGFDVGSYFTAARVCAFEHLCFLNSYSEILSEGWLRKMHEYIRNAEVGLVGATASYESMNFRPRLTWSTLKKALPKLTDNIRLALAGGRVRFPPFPNYHLRTNAFLISRDLMLQLKVGTMGSKMDVYLFESGSESMTRQILAKGLRALVVDRNGKAYDKERWADSRTFRIGEQENLLVADNQTRIYAAAAAQTRAHLTEITWNYRSGKTHPNFVGITA